MESDRPDEAPYSSRALEIYEQLGDPAHEFQVLQQPRRLRILGRSLGRGGFPVPASGLLPSVPAGQLTPPFTDGNVGEILFDQGHLDDAAGHFQRARRVLSATGDRQWVAYADALLARLMVRSGNYLEGRAMLEAARADLRRLGLDAYAELAHAWIAEAEALGGDPFRALEIGSQELQGNDRERPLLTRMAGIALTRLGERNAAVRELEHSLRTARVRGADYDIAATIDAMAAIDAADSALLSERDEIVGRLKIKLPTPALYAKAV